MGDMETPDFCAFGKPDMSYMVKKTPAFDKGYGSDSEESAVEDVDTQVPILRTLAVHTEDSSGSDYDTDIDTTVREPTPYDPWGKRVYLRTCRKLKITPITSVKRGLGSDTLELRHRGLTEHDVLAVCNALVENATVKTLILEGNQLNPKSCHYLALSMKENTNIEVLDLQNTGLDYKCSPIIAHLLLKNESIKHVNLSENFLDDCDIPYLEAVIERSKSIEHLNLSHNSLGEEAAKHISHTIANNDTIRVFDLSWNRFRATGVNHICKGLHENVGVAKLNLAMNGIALAGVRHICSLLLVNSTLTDVDLTCTRITNDGAFLLGKMLESNETVKIIRVSQNPMTHIGVLALLTGIGKNENSAMVLLHVLSVHCLQSTIEKYTDVREMHPKLRLIHGRVVDDDAPLEPLIHAEDAPDEESPMLILRRHLVVKRKKLIHVFRDMDLGPEPVLGKDIFKEGLKIMKIPLTTSQVDRLAEMIDQEGSGNVNFADIILREGESLVKPAPEVDENDTSDDEATNETGEDIAIDRPRLPERESFITGLPDSARSTRNDQII